MTRAYWDALKEDADAKLEAYLNLPKTGILSERAFRKLNIFNSRVTNDITWTETDLKNIICKHINTCSSGCYDIIQTLKSEKSELIQSGKTENYYSLDSIRSWIRQVSHSIVRDQLQYVPDFYLHIISMDRFDAFGFHVYDKYIVVREQNNKQNTLCLLRLGYIKETIIWLVMCRPHNYLFPMKQPDVYLFLYAVSSNLMCILIYIYISLLINIMVTLSNFFFFIFR